MSTLEREDDDEAQEEAHVHWTNLIFLPFHPIFQLIVMTSVITKTILGPIQSVYPVVYCWDVMDSHPFLSACKLFYWYCADPLYGIDMFLHIVHRQVTDEAMKREYLPKSLLFIILDFAAIIPFFRLMVTNDCPPVELWPNILAFSECLIMYRIFQYFDLSSTHSMIKMLFGFFLMMCCILNAMACFWLLLTYNGLCNTCTGPTTFDWRSTVEHKFNETGIAYSTYVYSWVYVFSFTANLVVDDLRPLTILEYLIVNIFVMFGYVVVICVMVPKIFAETILRYRRISASYPHVIRLIQETKRRNPSAKASESVEKFYDVMWKKRGGITRMPPVILDLPRCVRIDIKQDLSWALFHHSPTLRMTSISFKRFVIELITHDFKLPGEKFFAGPQNYSSLYYIKSGVVQFLSGDDGMTPILSVTSGTILGDINFLIPPWKRKVIIKCLTYTEVMCLTRHDYILAMHKFPQDRIEILLSAQERIEHARALYACKEKVRGLDRAEDEGFSWIKQRWWELANFIIDWTKRSRKDSGHCDLPPEETEYRCAKYIGQLVLCTEAQLLTKSLFSNVNFPWLFVPHSSFIFGWRKIVWVTVLLVLFLYPPYVIANDIPVWFKFFQVLVDLIYGFDIFVSLLTSMVRRGSAPTNFATVMFARCKTLYFNLDLLATIWIEYVVAIVGMSKYFYVAQANRLIKVYILFTGEFTQSNVKKNPLYSVYMIIFLTQFCSVYILCYLVYSLYNTFNLNLNVKCFFGVKYCTNTKSGICDPGAHGPFGVITSWIIETIIDCESFPNNLIDIYTSIVFYLTTYLTHHYCKTLFISAIYLKYRETSNFQSFVSSLKKYYKYYKIHQDLLKRLNRYLICHWKYYRGAEIMYPNIFKNEPFDIYWKVQGEVAERIISQSPAFVGADPGLVKDLAYAAKYLILPRTSTLYMFGVQSKLVTWVVQGYVKCEYHNEKGELLKVYLPPGDMLSVSSVFLGNVSLRTYSACTDCELIYIKIHDFYKIIQRYPNEWSHLHTCISEFAPVLEDMLHKYTQKHKDYQKKLRDRIFHARRSTVALKKIKELGKAIEARPALPVEYDFWTEPESEFMQYWMLFRAITVVVSIINAAIQGGSGVMYRRVLTMVTAFCDCVAWIDIVLKLFMAYYDEKGILVYDKQKCMTHYLTRGFVLDIIGCFPWNEVLTVLVAVPISQDTSLFMATICKFAHLYIFIGYMNYLSDRPTLNMVYITIFKWQMVLILCIFVVCHYLMTYCVEFHFNDHAELTSFAYRNSCWLPSFYRIEGNISDLLHLHLIYAASINFAQCGLVASNSGEYLVNTSNLGVGIPLAFLLLLFWFVTAYSLTLLILSSRGNTLFQHGVSQLKNFLAAERVEQKLINRAVCHFTYWWHRTKGINIQNLSNERIGVVFRQDLSYYFFKKTLLALNTILQSNENMCRQLASISSQIFIQPGDEILRQMDLICSVYVVHRGKIIISKDGDVVATLSKGSIFGHLEGTTARPVKISAQSEEHADLLLMNIKQFQDLITDDIRKIIAEHPTAKDGYIANKTQVVENPYDSIAYILRGRKTIYLPWMSAPQEAAHGKWYYRWLHLAWVIEPFLTVFVVLTMQTLTLERTYKMYYVIIVLDLLYFVNFMFEFYNVETEVVDKKCIHRKVGLRMFKKVATYIDITTLVFPLLTYPTRNVHYQLVKILRLRLLYCFDRHFCQSFKSNAGPILLKFSVLILLLYSFTCVWILIACKDPFPIPTPNDLSESFNKTVDFQEWCYPEDRPGGNSGCARMLRTKHPITDQPVFVVPKIWYHDYIIAVTYVLMRYTNTNNVSIVPINISQIYYQVIVAFIMFILDLWLISVTISYVYTKYRELYLYDYNVRNLITYLYHSGISPVLMNTIKKYTSLLWIRQRGNWLPELAQQAPMCLREDMLYSLYGHHLEGPPLLRDLPHYFKRQLAARLKRLVIFPGKVIIAEGDIFPSIYFIHEGEVEKWFKDKDGEVRLMSMLTTNGYFGQLSGLILNFPFRFTYYSRTVVDLVYLHRENWQDLLEGYPDVKRDLYNNINDVTNFAGYGKSYVEH